MFKFFDNIVKIIYRLTKYGTRGSETAIIYSHKLRFRFFKYRLYKVEMKSKTAYFIIEGTLPKFKYKSYHISGGLQRLTDYLFILGEKK